MEWQKDFDHRSCDKSKPSLLVTGSLAFSGVSHANVGVNCSFSNAQRAALTLQTLI